MKDKAGQFYLCGFILVAAVFVFLVLHRAGEIIYLTEDELGKGVTALRFISLLSGRGDLPFWNSVPAFVSCPLIMFFPYVGNLPIYFAAAFIFLFGSVLGNFFTLKLVGALAGIFVLGCVFAVVRRLAGRMTALLTVFFLAFNNMFILAVRSAFIREEIFQIAGFWFGLWLILKAQESGRGRLVFAAVFVFGLTLWTKIMFAGYIIGAGVGFLFLGRPGLRFLRTLFFPSFNFGVGCIVSFCSGALPFIYYNFDESFPVFGLMLRSLSGTGGLESNSSAVWSNTDVFSNLMVRLHDLWFYLCGGLFMTRTMVYVFPFLFVSALVWAVYYIFTTDRTDSRRSLLVVLVTGYFTLLWLSGFVVRFHVMEHVLILAPFCELLCALFVVWVCSRINALKLRRLFTVCVCLVWFAAQTGPWMKYSDVMDMSRGRAYLSAVEKDEVISELRASGMKNIVSSNCLGWVIKFFAPELNVFIVNNPADVATDKDFCEQFRSGEKWGAVLLMFDFDRELYENLHEQGVFKEPRKVTAFRDRDDCAVAFIDFDGK